MNDNISSQFAALPEALSGHLVVSVIPIALGVAISVPLGIALVRWPRAKTGVLGAVSLVQTIPGLALLALMVPVLVLVGKAVAPLGIEVPALGALPVMLALTLYAMLPVVRNTVAGIEGIDPALVEAAEAIGMTPGQALRQVQLPLAAPVILAGVRTAAVWVVGMGTLATPVGQNSMGNYIFAGLQTRNPVAVLFGCVGAAALALLVDGALAAVERAVALRRPRRAVAAIVSLGSLVLLGIAAPRIARPPGAGPSVVVGSKTFTEQYILSALLEDVLRDAGFRPSAHDSLGSTVVLDALFAGQVDVYVEYTGTLWANALHRTDAATGPVVQQAVCDWVASRGGKCAGALGFENAYALAVRRADAETHHWKTVADLATDAGALAIGGDYEFFQRPEWASLKSAYHLVFGREQTFDPSFLYGAVHDGSVDAISAYSSDGRIAAFDLVVLADPAGALPPYDAVVLLGPKAPDGTEAAIEPLIGAIDVERMRQANKRVDVDGETPEAAARWLQSAALGQAGRAR
jgi:osmoprotectant transport system permease protein